MPANLLGWVLEVGMFGVGGFEGGGGRDERFLEVGVGEGG